MHAGRAIAQAVHAGYEFGTSNSIDTNGFVYILKVENEEHLLHVEKKIISKGYPYYMFKEPDFNNEVTCICTVGDPRMFSSLKKY